MMSANFLPTCYFRFSHIYLVALTLVKHNPPEDLYGELSSGLFVSVLSLSFHVKFFWKQFKISPPYRSEGHVKMGPGGFMIAKVGSKVELVLWALSV
jgi:hypothetical protein